MGILEALIAALIAVISSCLVYDQPPAPVFTPNATALVGDSVTAQNMESFIVGLDECVEGTTMIVNAQGGRQMLQGFNWEFPGDYRAGYQLDQWSQSGLEVIERLERDVDPHTWIIELGVNDAINGNINSPEEADNLIDSALALLDTTDTVYWVNTYTVAPMAHPGVELFNEALLANPRLSVIDWASIAPFNTPDGTHPSPEAARTLVDMYCKELTP